MGITRMRMKYYKDSDNNVFAYAADGSDDKYISDNLILIDEKTALELASPPLTQEQKNQQVEAERKQLMSDAAFVINPLRDALDGGYITDDDKPRLTAWQRYRYDLTRVDLAKPVWPPKPE